MFTLIALLCILAYIAIRFEVKSAVMAVITLAINVLVMMAVYLILYTPLNTTFIAAIFLSFIGTGSIQGFAVSLAIGVVSSVFTALFVSRLIFDVGTEALKREKISIGWRIK